VGDGVIGAEEQGDAAEEQRQRDARVTDDMRDFSRRIAQESKDSIRAVLGGMQEASYAEELHPRGRGGKWINKMFHVAPKGKRAEIEKHGIDSTRGMPIVGTKPMKSRGNYLWTSPEAVQQMYAPSLHDVWEVDTHDVSVRPDPEGIGHAVLTQDVIPPDRLHRVELRDGKWTRVEAPRTAVAPGGPAQEMSPDEWHGFMTKVRADPFSSIKPGDDAGPVVNALHMIDSGWTMSKSLNRDELPTGSLPFGVEGFTRFDKQFVEPGEPPDSLVLHLRQKKGGGLEVMNAGHGSMVWDHMIATPEMRAEEVRVWKEGQAQIAAERAQREARVQQARAKRAEAVAAIESAVTSANGEALRRALGNQSMADASAMLESAGLQHRQRTTEADGITDTLRGKHGETVTIVGQKEQKDWHKEMEDAVDQMLDPNGKLDDRLTYQAVVDLRKENDRRPAGSGSSAAAAAWQARRDAVVKRLATQHYNWVGREVTSNHPEGLWAILQGEDGNRYNVDWGGNLHLSKPDEKVIEGPRDDRRLTEEQKRGGVIAVQITPNPQGGRRTRLPEGQAPKNLDELLVDTLGRADELGQKYGTGVNVAAVVHDIVNDGAAAVHEWNGTISIEKRYLDDIEHYLSGRAYAAANPGVSQSDRDHLRFYNDLEILQHEINHGVGVDGGITSRNYQGLGKNVEEGLTEETAHLEVADWLRSYGMTDVLEAVKRNPDDYNVTGTYFDYRTQLKKLMDDAGLDDGQRRQQLRMMKFQMTPEQQYAEIIRLAQIRRPNVTDLGAALPSPGLSATQEFEPIVRPDLSDIETEISSLVTKAGQTIQRHDRVQVRLADGGLLEGFVTGLRPDEGSGTGGWVEVATSPSGEKLWYALDRVV
jgi:hypothetical protein